jgi:hypothetical protein
VHDCIHGTLIKLFGVCASQAIHKTAKTASIHGEHCRKEAYSRAEIMLTQQGGAGAQNRILNMCLRVAVFTQVNFSLRLG